MTLYMISPLQDRICSGLERRGPRPPFPDPLSRQRKAVLCGSGGPAESAHPVTDLGPEAQGGARHSSPPVLAGVGRFPGGGSCVRMDQCAWESGRPVYVRHVPPAMIERGLGSVLLTVPVGVWTPRRMSRVSCPEVSREISLCVSPSVCLLLLWYF